MSTAILKAKYERDVEELTATREGLKSRMRDANVKRKADIHQVTLAIGNAKRALARLNELPEDESEE